MDWAQPNRSAQPSSRTGGRSEIRSQTSLRVFPATDCTGHGSLLLATYPYSDTHGNRAA